MRRWSQSIPTLFSNSWPKGDESPSVQKLVVRLKFRENWWTEPYGRHSDPKPIWMELVSSLSVFLLALVVAQKILHPSSLGQRGSFLLFDPNSSLTSSYTSRRLIKVNHRASSNPCYSVSETTTGKKAHLFSSRREWVQFPHLSDDIHCFVGK